MSMQAKNAVGSNTPGAASSAADLGRFLEAKMEVKIDFGEVFFGCFFQLRFRIVFKSFLAGSHLEKSIKTIGFSMVFANFAKSIFSRNLTKMVPFWLHFGKPKPLKIDENACLKQWLFPTLIFWRFFAIFSDFELILGGPGVVNNDWRHFRLQSLLR